MIECLPYIPFISTYTGSFRNVSGNKCLREKMFKKPWPNLLLSPTLRAWAVSVMSKSRHRGRRIESRAGFELRLARLQRSPPHSRWLCSFAQSSFFSHSLVPLSSQADKANVGPLHISSLLVSRWSLFLPLLLISKSEGQILRLASFPLPVPGSPRDSATPVSTLQTTMWASSLPYCV